MYAKIFLSLMLSMVLISCKKDLVPQDSSVTPVATSPATATTPNADGSNAAQQNPAVQQNPVQQAPAVVAKGMNPAHGQPNHRCDIAVGAPLSTPATTKSQTIAPQVQQPGTAAVQQINPNVSAVPQTLQAPVETAEGMNPPHGQEGHLCSIAVGAPLPK